MAYVPVPKDLNAVKTKVLFNLTKRQLICFGGGAAIAVPLFFLCKSVMSTSAASIIMIIVLLPFMLLAMYEKNGQPLEKIVWNIVQVCFLRPKQRPYRTNNFYAVLERQENLDKEVYRIRKELNQHNRYYAQMNDMVATLQENATDLLDECSSSRLQYILRRLNRLQEETQMLREYASQVSSEYQAQVDLGQNRIMKLLTIVTTNFMPLSLIAGWYGMNFVNMPELHRVYGYPAVIVLSALIVGGCIFYFKKKRYW